MKNGMARACALWALAWMAGHGVAGERDPWAGFAVAEAREVVLASGFEGDDPALAPFRARPYAVAPRGGVNGGAALSLVRTDPNEYVFHSIPLPPLDPNKRYVLAVDVRLKARGGNAPGRGTEFIGVEFMRGANYLAGQYGKEELPDDEWRRHEIHFTPPPDAAGHLTPFMQRGVTGTMYWDNLELAAVGERPDLLLTWPSELTIRRGETEGFRLQAASAAPKTLAARATVESGGRASPPQYLELDEHHRFAGAWGDVAAGPVTLRVALADTTRRVTFGERTFSLAARDPGPAPLGACRIDEHGRALVDGRPFMPLGVYAAYTEDDFRRVAEAGFNCVMIYETLSTLTPGADLGDKEANIRGVMDLLDRHGLRLLFSLKDQLPFHAGGDSVDAWGEAKGKLAVAEKAVRLFKGHPALLGWYISDEEPLDRVENVVALREAVSRIDPHHPTWSLTCHIASLPHYGVSGDVIGVDPYPITRDPAAPQSIRPVVDFMRAANATGLPVWAVPQMFNWASHQLPVWDRAAWETTRGPNAEEMRAMPLLAAIHGAKGFVFFAFADIYHKNEAVMPGAGKEEWEEKAVPTARALVDMAPFILSLAPAPEVTVACEPEGEVHARAFADDAGRLRVVVVGLGKPSSAVITVADERPLRSRHGKTRALGGGRYRFTANAVDSDILAFDE